MSSLHTDATPSYVGSFPYTPSSNIPVIVSFLPFVSGFPLAALQSQALSSGCRSPRGGSLFPFRSLPFPTTALNANRREPLTYLSKSPSLCTFCSPRLKCPFFLSVLGRFPSGSRPCQSPATPLAVVYFYFCSLFLCLPLPPG